MLLLVFILHERKLGDGALLDLSLFYERGYSLGVIVGFLLMFGMMGVFYILPLYWQMQAGFSPAQAGIALMPMTISMLVITPLTGALTDKLAPKIIMLLGSALAALGTGIIAFLISNKGAESQLMIPLFLSGTGMALLQTPLTASVMAFLPQEKASSGSSALTTARQLGSLIAVAVITMTISMVDEGLQASLSIVYVCVAYLICVVLLLFMKKEKIAQIVGRKSRQDTL